jgi:hypothetical protein
MLLKSTLAMSSLLVAALILCPLATGQKPQQDDEFDPQGAAHRIDPKLDPSKFGWIFGWMGVDAINDKAKATDDAGIHAYAEYLIRQIVPKRAGEKYIRSLTDRLAAAEEAARAGKGPLVPEANVVQAYNDLMKQIGAPNTTNDNAVQTLRFAPSKKPVDALISWSRNGANCNPGEAVYLLDLVIAIGGGPKGTPPKRPVLRSDIIPAEGRSTMFFTMSPGASNQTGQEERAAPRSRRNKYAGEPPLQAYSDAHRPHATAELFNNVAKTLGF